MRISKHSRQKVKNKEKTHKQTKEKKQKGYYENKNE